MRPKSIILGLAFAATAATGYVAGAAKKVEGVMLAADEIKWEPYDPKTPENPLKVAILWGDRFKSKDFAMLLKVPGGAPANWHSHSVDYHAVNVAGTWQHALADGKMKDLPPGSYVFQPGKQLHGDACKAGTDCIIFAHQHGKNDYIPGKDPNAPAAPAAPPK
jgi:quercetin dioxygenase-like cupin family protein